MEKQYSNYTIKEINAPLDGAASLQENVADNGGINHAYLAYGMFKCFKFRQYT